MRINGADQNSHISEPLFADGRGTERYFATSFSPQQLLKHVKH